MDTDGAEARKTKAESGKSAVAEALADRAETKTGQPQRLKNGNLTAKNAKSAERGRPAGADTGRNVPPTGD